MPYRFHRLPIPDGNTEDDAPMTRETQNVEWKTSWRDEYLQWICGFANAQGGILEIGRNDRGEVIGVSDVPASARGNTQ